jgi:hypothetical protein
MSEDEEIRATIEREINSRSSRRAKTNLLVQFVGSVPTAARVDAQWQLLTVPKKAAKLNRIRFFIRISSKYPVSGSILIFVWSRFPRGASRG